MSATTEETRRVLLRMKEELVAGWVQHALWTKDGVCVFGALVRAADLPLHVVKTPLLRKLDTFYNADDVPAASEVVCLLDDLVGFNFVRWNDVRSRTQADVIALIDRALEVLAEEKSGPASAAVEAAAV